MSFLPLVGGAYLLGTNRDESPVRGHARPPAVFQGPEGRSIMPLDPDAGGTWIRVDEYGRSLCILNGDQPVVPPPSEAPSRGTLVLELSECATLTEMHHLLKGRHADGLLAQRAFKLLIAELGANGLSATAALIEWNGRDVPRLWPLEGPCVLVSSAFDPAGVSAYRQSTFSCLSSMPTTDPDALAAAQSLWHASHAEDEPGGGTLSVCMHREEASTVSFTAVRVDAHRVQMTYQAGAPCEGARPVSVFLDTRGSRRR
ncbi:MAG: NRDE family protein [Planctomycetota bacterium]|nr:NRDE family protein [Planctomycetota bacterium]